MGNTSGEGFNRRGLQYGDDNIDVRHSNREEGGLNHQRRKYQLLHRICATCANCSSGRISQKWLTTLEPQKDKPVSKTAGIKGDRQPAIQQRRMIWELVLLFVTLT